jgi:hypothetical protein
VGPRASGRPDAYAVDDAVAGVPDAPTRLRTHASVLHLLRDHRTLELLQDIATVKRTYEQARATASPRAAVQSCSFLTCGRAGVEGMNSRLYCRRHVGLALINGMRHVCDACHLLSVLALKGDPTSGGHGHNTLLTLAVPLRDQGTLNRDRLNLRIRRFCVDRERGFGELRYQPSGGGTYRTAAGQWRRVPPRAWCFFGRNGLVDAWIQVMYEDLRATPGTYLPVDTRERLEYVLHSLGWTGNEFARFGFCPPLATNAPTGSWGADDDDGGGW